MVRARTSQGASAAMAARSERLATTAFQPQSSGSERAAVKSSPSTRTSVVTTSLCPGAGASTAASSPAPSSTPGPSSRSPVSRAISPTSPISLSRFTGGLPLRSMSPPGPPSADRLHDGLVQPRELGQVVGPLGLEVLDVAAVLVAAALALVEPAGLEQVGGGDPRERPGHPGAE